MAGEDYDLAAMARYLQVTPAEVRKMAERDRLPGRRVGGEWRFSQADIHHWMEDQISESDESELVHVEKLLGEPDSHLDTVHAQLIETVIEIPLAARTKPKVIKRLCQLAADAGVLWDPEKLEEAIRAREQMHSTALENGVALLHSRRPMASIIGEPFVGLGLTQAGIPFGGPRGVLTDVFFLIGSVDESQHLRTLARISRMICEPAFLPRLRESGSAAEVSMVIEEFDTLLGE